MQLVSATQVRQLTGRPRTGRLDAVWLARLTEKGLLRPSFVPPAEIRALRDCTRARTHLVQDRTRCWQRLEKLLEDALIKVSAVASKMTTASVQDMIEALIGGERDPHVLAGLARGRMKAKHAALAEALTGVFDDHHAELAQILLDQISFTSTRITALTRRIEDTIDAIPAAWGIGPDGATGTTAGSGPHAAALPAIMRLGEIPGISAELACSIIAESGSPGALPRRGPLRTVRARRPGTRLKQAPGALRVGLASCVCGPGARGGRRRVSSGFEHRPACRACPGGRGSRR